MICAACAQILPSFFCKKWAQALPDIHTISIMKTFIMSWTHFTNEFVLFAILFFARKKKKKTTQYWRWKW